MATHSIYITLFLALLIHSTFNPKVCNATRVLSLPPQPKGNTEFIKSSCRLTTYRELCFNSLSSYASTIQTSPMQLAHTALSVSLDGARSMSATMKGMMSATGRANMSPREGGAMRDCMANARDSMMQLQDSLSLMGHMVGGKDMAFQLNSVQTWVSAALTDDDTCMEGFDGSATNGAVKDAVGGHVLNVAQLTSNALALINSLAYSLQSSSP